MKVDNPRLEIFNGKIAPNEFMEDVEIFLSLDTDLKKEVIRNTLSWYPKKDIDEDWNKWMAGKSDEEKERMRKAVKSVLFTMKMGIVKQFTDEHFAEELKKIGFDFNLIEFFLSELNKKKETIVQKIEKTEVLVIDKLTDLNWRIDVKKSSQYTRKIDELCVILKMSLSGGETKEIVFELSYEELSSLMRTFSLIQKEIERFKMEETE